MKININDIEIPADESILPELSRQLLDLLNNSYKAVYSRNLSAEDRDKLVAVSNQIIDIICKICSTTCTQTGPE